MNEVKEKDSAGKIISKKILILMIQYLLDNKEITPNVSKKDLDIKIDDLIKSTFIEEIQVSLTITEETYNLFEEQFNKGNNNMAIILASTYLEQLINEFYQEYLLYKKDFSKDECDSCLKSLKIKDKFGWFYKYSFNDSFNKKLYQYISLLFAKRNSIIHYIPEVELLVEEKEKNLHFDISLLKNNVDMITKELSKKSTEIFGNNLISQNICDRYYRD